MAATTVRKVLVDRAAKHFEEETEALDIAEGKVFVRADPSQTVELRDLARMCAAEGWPWRTWRCSRRPSPTRSIRRQARASVLPDFTFGALRGRGGGRYRDRRGQRAQGRGMSRHWPGDQPRRAEGQIGGGGMQGLGYGLMEDLIVKDGVIQDPSFAEYLIPTAMDYPTTSQSF